MKLHIEFEHENERNTPINMAAAIINWYEPTTWEQSEVRERRKDLEEVVDHIQAFLRRGNDLWEPF